MLIDCHVHSGNWKYQLLKDTGLPYYMSDYWDQYSDTIDAAIFTPSDLQDNQTLLSDVSSDSRSYMAYWINPKSETMNHVFDVVSVNPKIVALKVHGGIDQIDSGIANEVYAPYIEFSIYQKIPIIVHCGANKGTSSYLYLDAVAEKYPQAKFIAAHLGAKFDIEQAKAIDCLSVRENVYADTSSVKYPYIITRAIDMFGPERVLFGSDWPIMSPLSAIGAMSDSLLEEEIEALKETPFKVFNIEKSTISSSN